MKPPKIKVFDEEFSFRVWAAMVAFVLFIWVFMILLFGGFGPQ